MRRLICDAIESLILLLDEIDGDADLEEDDPGGENGDAEPSLGAFGHIDQTVAWRTRDSGYGGEDRELDEADKEPSLGAPECHPSLGAGPVFEKDGSRYLYSPSGSQAHWADGGMRDLEHEHDGREPDADAEPTWGPAVMA